MKKHSSFSRNEAITSAQQAGNEVMPYNAVSFSPPSYDVSIPDTALSRKRDTPDLTSVTQPDFVQAKRNPGKAQSSSNQTEYVLSGFGTDSDKLTAEHLSEIEKIASNLNRFPLHFGGSVIIEGHTDSRGSERHNLLLGHRRAIKVREKLLPLVKDAGTQRQIMVKSRGEKFAKPPGNVSSLRKVTVSVSRNRLNPEGPAPTSKKDKCKDIGLAGLVVGSAAIASQGVSDQVAEDFSTCVDEVLKGILKDIENPLGRIVVPEEKPDKGPGPRRPKFELPSWYRKLSKKLREPVTERTKKLRRQIAELLTHDFRTSHLREISEIVADLIGEDKKEIHDSLNKLLIEAGEKGLDEFLSFLYKTFISPPQGMVNPFTPPDHTTPPQIPPIDDLPPATIFQFPFNFWSLWEDQWLK